MKYVALQHEKIEIGPLSDKLINKNHGGTNLFVGTIREWTGDIQTEEIRYTSYEEMALKELTKLAVEVETKWGGGCCYRPPTRTFTNNRCRCGHRCINTTQSRLLRGIQIYY